MDFLPDGVAFNKNITYLAKTNFRATEQVFGIKRKDRRQHMYVLGKSGSGKSALLGNMIVQNIWNGEGVCVIDPHGELVESVLATIPAHRAKDVVYFNPADTDYHIGFNVLHVDDPKYKHLVASGLMGIFTKIWANAWSARMEYILNNAILALADTPGSTLLGIPRLLVDKDYRQVVINNLKDPVIKAFWVHEYETWRDQYRNEAIAPIQNKVGQFLSTSIVRNVVGQAKSTIDLFEMMNSGKIFLVNVSKGRIGEDNSALLGGMIITKLQLAAMERVRIPEDERKDFYLYVDEFQNFVTDSFASILSEARKYRLNLTLAHQYIAQLVTKDSEAVRDAVFGNVGTMIVFRVGAADADFLEKEFEPEFMVQDMVNLPNYHAYLKLMVDGVTSRPFSAKTLPPFRIPENSKVAAEIIESSRKLYARPREVVEREINDWSGMLVGVQEEGKFKAVCSSCGKDTMVPFEPEPGRPVYCKDCIAKIKSGELKPIKGTRSRSLEPQSYAALAGLGIEFVADVQTSKSQPTTYNSPNISAASPATRQDQVKMTPSSYAAPVFEKPKSAYQSNTPAPVAKPAVEVVLQKDTQVVPPVKAEAVVHQRNIRPARERRGPDHDGLQSILKQALGDVINKNEAPKKEEVKPVVDVVVEEKKTISLESLKNHDQTPSHLNHSNHKIPGKTASDEHVSALQMAIAKASQSKEQENKIVPEQKIDIVKEPEIIKSPVVEVSKLIPLEIPKESVPSKTEKIEEEKITEPIKIPETPIKEESKSEEKEEPKQEDVSVKKVKEIPEDILRKVLNE